jgi:glycerol-3-phosphate dehydrogenase (NAD(P)+)
MSARLDVLGAGAFGTALAIAYAQAGHEVTLWARDGAEEMRRTRENARRLPGYRLPHALRVTGDLSDLTGNCALLALPTQTLGGFLAETDLRANTLVSCAKGIDRATGLGPTALIARHSKATVAQLTGPSFAVDIAAGLPTALTLACADDAVGRALQESLSLPALRLYRTTDVIGAELGGALKNVVAIAAGAVIGAGLGDSARAALMARGLAEMTRIAVAAGGQDATLSGLSGLGDLILTCGSEKSRNFRYGMALARGKACRPM